MTTPTYVCHNHLTAEIPTRKIVTPNSEGHTCVWCTYHLATFEVSDESDDELPWSFGV